MDPLIALEIGRVRHQEMLRRAEARRRATAAGPRPPSTRNRLRRLMEGLHLV